MPQCTYLFYDIETTGLNKCFDQVIQFAAIRTNQQLQELARYEYLIQLNPDVIPDPSALLTHGFGVQQLQQGKKEFEAIREIHQLLNTPGTISIGYNSLGFDDEFLRFCFYRNLLAPYTHQYANQCSRMDLYPITILYYLFKPEVLEWPILNGKISLKLEKLNEANHWISGTAHHAMVDVEVTLALAKKFFQQADMWSYACSYFDKKQDLTRLAQLKEAIIVHGRLGFENNFQAPALFMGQHHHYKNQFLWLRLDNPELQKTTPENIAQTTSTFRKKAGEEILLLPMLKRFCDQLNPQRLQIAEENKAWLVQNHELFQKICAYHQNYQYPQIPQLDIDAALYETNFPTPYEESLFHRFHQAELKDKFEIIQLFPSPMRQQQALRILGRNYPEYLSPLEKQNFQNYQQKIFGTPANDCIFDFQGKKKRTASEVLTQITTLEQTPALNDAKKQLLNDLKNFLTQCSLHK